MTVLKLKYLKVYRNRLGVEYHYFRRKGCPEAALPGEPLSEEFMAAYHACMSRTKLDPVATKTCAPAGTVKDALTQWYASVKFQNLEPKTRHHYRQMMERELAPELHAPIARLKPRHIEGWIEDMVAGDPQRDITPRPGAAKSFLRRLKTFMKFCAKRGLTATNLAENVDAPQYESEGFAAWTDDDATTFEAYWPIDSKQRLTYALLTYTGQRISDVAKMGRQDESGGYITVAQAKLRKNKKRVTIRIPIHPELRRTIDAHGIDGRMIYLQTGWGKAFSAKGLSQDFSRWATEAGLAPEKTAHGVRKLAGARLADAGCTEKEIMSVLGLSSFREAATYTATANQRRLASGAMEKLRTPAKTV